jgi:hypothetical protein
MPLLYTTKFNIAAATDLLTEHSFRYVLPAVFSQDPLEKFFGQARQRFGGNFYIDIGDVIAAAKVQRLHQLLKLDIIPKDDVQRTCSNCTATPDEQDLDLLQDITTDDTEKLLDSDDSLKHKIIFVAGFLTRKYEKKQLMMMTTTRKDLVCLVSSLDSWTEEGCQFQAYQQYT